MYVKDYDFICDISKLFETNIIIYGAGFQGKKTAELLDEIKVEYDCFCDRNSGIGEYLGHPVITAEELKKKTESEECFIIIGSIDYCTEIAEELQRKEIKAYVCSWYGIRTGIEMHITDERLPKDFKDFFTLKKEIWIRSMEPRGNLRARQREFCSNSDSVLIYQPGKVGSRTIFATLNKAKINVLHLHTMYDKSIGSDAELPRLISQMRNWGKQVRMIVGVRDPIARSLATFMQMFTHDYLSDYNLSRSIEENAWAKMESQLEKDWLFSRWFDNELNKVTGIDVYEYPFDKERGYTWIKERGIEILLYKMEQMNEIVDVLGEFVGSPGLVLVNKNVGKEKQYRYIYEELKNRIKIPVEVIEQQYQSPKFLHFYTEEEKERFMRLWMK